MATTINAGRVRFVSRGTYNNSTQYYLFDLVDYNGSSYIAKENSLGNLPTNTQYWQLIAEKGNTGNTGATGPVGPTGNGISSITKTGTDGLVDTYTITYTNGNITTFTITNGEDGEVTETELNVLRQKLENQQKVIDQLPQVEGQGTSITLENTIEAPFTIFDVEGNSTQESTKGYQLFDIGKSASDYSSNVGNSLVINEKSIQMKVLPSGQTITYRTQNLIGNKKYTINGNASLVYSRLYVRMRKNDDSGWLTNSDASIEGWSYNSYYQGWYKENEPKAINQTVTIPECKYWQIGFGFNSLEAAVNTTQTISDIMLNEGTSAHEWEKYTGGTASPNPNYEQPIKSAGDNGSINEKIQTRNWFDVSKISQLIKNGTTTSDGITNIDNVITINKTNGQHGSYAMNYLIPIKSGQITVSFKALLSGTNSSTGILVALYNSTATIYATTAQTKYASSKNKWLDYSATFELNQEAIDGIHLDIQASNTGNVIQIKDIQVELGSTATPYVPHKEQDYSIFVQQPFRRIGDVRDLFFKNVKGSKYYNEDLEENKWYERHLRRKVFDGTENWQFSTGSGVAGIYMLNPPIDDMVQGNFSDGLSNYFHNDKSGKGKNSIRFGANNNVIYIYVDSNEFPDKTSFTSWLAEKYASGHPLYIDYISAEPLDLPCTPEQIQQIENKPNTYKEMTIINSEDETPAYLEVSGIYDLNKLINN